jgi:hypothetical protein
MNANPDASAQHPHFVPVPDPKHAEGVRAYREPTEPHPLQIKFLEPAGESAWVEEMRTLLSDGRVLEADARLATELAGFEGALARICRATHAADVTLEGWDDLLPVLEEWEGPPITGITLGLTNPCDLVFEAGRTHDPELLLGLYSDDAFPFSRASNHELLAECGKESPGWSGAEEDVEFYCTISGLAELNTALIQCKHRRFLRDGRDGVEGRAPGGYVEFVLGCWLLATRFLQATEVAISRAGLPAGCRLIVGTVDVNADFVSLLGSSGSLAPHPAPAATAAGPAFASLTMKPWVPREDPTADSPASGPTLRERLKPLASAPEVQAKPGFFARLFASFRGR